MIIDYEEQTEMWMQELSTNQQRCYGIAYEERRRRDMSRPATEDNVRTIKRYLVTKTGLTYLEARHELRRQASMKVRPYDLMHVVNVVTFNAEQRVQPFTKTWSSTPTDTTMAPVDAVKPRNHVYTNLGG